MPYHAMLHHAVLRCIMTVGDRSVQIGVQRKSGSDRRDAATCTPWRVSAWLFFAETWICLLLNRLCLSATLGAIYYYLVLSLLSITDKIK